MLLDYAHQDTIKCLVPKETKSDVCQEAQKVDTVLKVFALFSAQSTTLSRLKSKNVYQKLIVGVAEEEGAKKVFEKAEQIAIRETIKRGVSFFVKKVIPVATAANVYIAVICSTQCVPGDACPIGAQYP